MQRSTLPFARGAAGTKRTAHGRLSRKRFRNCSRITNGVAPIRPSATGIPTHGRRSYSRPLLPGESHEKDRRAFERDHASDWIVISAIRSDHQRGMTECVATLGGDRRAAEQRRYLVPSDEYQIGRFGFVINEARHRLYGGPSNFVGWR